MGTVTALSRKSSGAPAVDPADAVRYDDLRLLPQGITPGSVLNLGPVTPARPAQNHFALQLARDGDAAITTVPLLGLAEGFEESPYFLVNAAKNAVQMRASVGGPTTGGATSARCEMRELDLAGQNMGFDALTGTHQLRVKFRVTASPTNLPDIVVAQLHNGSADRVAIRTQLVSGTLRLRCRINGTSVGTELANPYVLGTWVEVLIEIVAGTVNVYFALADAALPTSPQISQSAVLVSTGSASWYFKWGCYLQSPVGTDVATDFGIVEHQPPTHWHTGWPTPARYYPAAQHAALHAPGGPDALRPGIVDLGDIAAGGTVTPASIHLSLARARLLGATAILAAPTSPGDGDVVNVELYPTVACTLTIAAAIVPTGGLPATVALTAGKLWSAALRYRAATVPATAPATWRLLAASPDN